jgi:hypothetical protein
MCKIPVLRSERKQLYLFAADGSRFFDRCAGWQPTRKGPVAAGAQGRG